MVTTWDIAPNYDEWGYDTSWNCDDWMTWHKHLKAHFGDERAKLIWNYAYAQGSGFSSHWDCRTFNSNFRTYARENKLDTYASVKLPILPQVLDLSGSVFDLANGVSDTISEIAGVFGNTKTIRTAIYVALAVGVGYLGYRGYKAYKNNIGTK